ncbi:hypothetical protein [Nocardioides bigeumensis]|jgi:hypothetical protein|uniref:Uncharacterized protein n=1 Tax=Nocardioides bigeumensis TaxID=433657 RepID=A0ABN2XN00_9ACTN
MTRRNGLRQEPTSPYDDVVRHARILSMLPGLAEDGALTPEWTAWLISMDEVLERAEIAARDDSVDLSLAFRSLREDLNSAVAGSGAQLHIDVETAEVVTIRAAQLATRGDTV